MAVSKRLRYEVLRRDSHACRYCGATAPEAKLTVDHVVPVALGGSDDPSNLVAACGNCNSGKTSTSPDAPLVANVGEDALRWSHALVAAADQMRGKLTARQDVYDEFDAFWGNWTYGFDKKPIPKPSDWQGSIDSFLVAGLPMDVLKWCVEKAMASKATVEATWKYMCGIAWRKVSELQEAAQYQVANPADAEDDEDGEYEVRQDERRHMACELLGDLASDERDGYLRIVGELLGQDDPSLYEVAAFRAFRNAIRDRQIALRALRHLLDSADGGHQCLTDARETLEAQHGQNFTETALLFLAVNMATGTEPTLIRELL